MIDHQFSTLKKSPLTGFCAAALSRP